MEVTIKAAIQDGRVEISKQITDVLGTDLKSICMNGVWLVIAESKDKRFDGEPLQSNGEMYTLPKSQMSALGLSQGDVVRLVFSDVLGIIILQKLDE